MTPSLFPGLASNEFSTRVESDAHVNSWRKHVKPTIKYRGGDVVPTGQSFLYS